MNDKSTDSNSSDKQENEENPTTSGETAKVDKLPIYEKGLYGLGQKALTTSGAVVDHQIQQVMVFGMGMSPAWHSMIIMIYRLWDAFSDPLMGWISDNTRTRWGRRRPYMVLGSILMAAFLPVVWQFNETWHIFWCAVWLTVAGMIMSTFTTMYNMPWQTLKLEMTPDYKERVSINMWMAWLGIPINIMFYWIWSLTQHPFFTGQAPGEEPDTLAGIRTLAFFAAGLVLFFGLIPPLVAKERYYKKASNQVKTKLLPSIKETFKSKPFLMLLGIILAGNLDGLVIGMGAYITTYFVFGGDTVFAAKFTGITGTIGTLMSLASIPFMGWLARKFGKHRALLIQVTASTLMVLSILVFYNPKYPWLAAVPIILNNVINGVFWIVIPSIKADVVDEDELRTGLRREGSFESIFSWVLRTTGTLLGGVSGFLVIWAGFDIDLGSEQGEGTFWRMKLMMATFPLLFGAIQLYLIMKWPLTEEKMADIRAKLEERRGAIN